MITDQEFSDAAQRIVDGGLVAFPTETVYGLGANALDVDAVSKVFELKGRPTFDPLIVHVASPKDLDDLISDFPRPIEHLVNEFWPGPLSVVLPKRRGIPDLVTSGLPSVAVRCPSHPDAARLIRNAGVPIAAPSANRFGCISPTTADHVREQFREAAPMILDGGPCQVGVESTVVGFQDDDVILYRPGGVTIEAIEEVVGSVRHAGTDDSSPSSPGQLTKHYAPSVTLEIASGRIQAGIGERLGLLGFSPSEEAQSGEEYCHIEFLTESGSLREAAANLFAAMRRLDAAGVDRIIARPVPEVGLGVAIMDRLRRASAS